MRYVKVVFKFYITSSIHVALSVVSLSIISFLKFNIEIDYALIAFIFLATITGYNFVKYAPVAKLHHRSLTHHLRIIQVFSLICFFALLVSCFYLKVEVFLLSIILGLFNLFYAIPLTNRNLREIPLIKIFIIASIWTIVTVILPFFYAEANTSFNQQWQIESAERFLMVCLLMVPFEIRDYPFDKTYLKTIMSVFGLRTLKVISVLLIIVLLSLRLWLSEGDSYLFYIIMYFSLAICILASKTKQKAYFASFWVEALPIFWLLSLMVLQV